MSHCISRRKAGEPSKAIAADYGIGKGVVYDIARGATWQYLTTGKRRYPIA